MFKTKKVKIMSLIVLFIVLATMCYFFPYTGDDWYWGSDSGMENFKYFFAHHNGRYLGNIMVVFVARYNILKTILISLTIIGICYLCYKINNKRNILSFILPLFLLLVMPMATFRQAITWTSGFINYTFAILLLLILFYIVKKNWNNKAKAITIILASVIGFLSCLFAENVTLALLVILLILNIYNWIKHKKINSLYLFMLIAVTIGNITMFQHPIYRDIAKGQDFYREIPKGITGYIITALSNYCKTIKNSLILDNFFINLILCTIVIYLLKDNKKRHIKFLFRYLIAFIAYSFIHTINPSWQIIGKYSFAIEAVISGIYILTMIYLIILISLKEKKYTTIIIGLLIAVFTGPLFFINPIGPRNFCLMYILFILIILEILNYIKLNEKHILKISVILLVISFVQIVFLTSIYFQVDYVNNLRINHIKENYSEEDIWIDIPKLPYQEYVWSPELINDYFRTYFNVRHDIPAWVKYNYVSYEEWLTNRK